MFQLQLTVPVATVITSFYNTYKKRISRTTVQTVQDSALPQSLTGTDVDKALQYLRFKEHNHVVLQQHRENGPPVSNRKTIGLTSIGDSEMKENLLNMQNAEQRNSWISVLADIRQAADLSSSKPIDNFVAHQAIIANQPCVEVALLDTIHWKLLDRSSSTRPIGHTDKCPFGPFIRGIPMSRFLQGI
ncbi:unnamed protein product [Cylindrotheca closterium]|uniref:Uncharacterized protein n=1 Tax=Cylindrotheca closterium TaxID=2856 RepID=A0AAD2FUF0_9STRA|nr:unnamed protein product [Cylindrotheca closterium]